MGHLWGLTKPTCLTALLFYNKYALFFIETFLRQFPLLLTEYLEGRSGVQMRWATFVYNSGHQAPWCIRCFWFYSSGLGTRIASRWTHVCPESFPQTQDIQGHVFRQSDPFKVSQKLFPGHHDGSASRGTYCQALWPGFYLQDPCHRKEPAPASYSPTSTCVLWHPHAHEHT